MKRSIEDSVLIRYSSPFQQVSDIMTQVDLDEEKVDWNRLLYLAKENKVLLSLLENLSNLYSGMPRRLTERLENARKRETRICKQWRRTLIFLLDEFKEHHIPVLLIKGPRAYPHCSVDLDFLVQNLTDMRRAAETLANVGYQDAYSNDRRKITLVPRPGSTPLSPEVDLYSSIGWRNVRLSLLDHRTIWKRRRTAESGGIQIPAPSIEDDLLILCAHSVFGHRRYFLGDLFHFEKVTAGMLDWNYVQDVSERFGWSIGLHYFLRCSDALYRCLYGAWKIPQVPMRSLSKRQERMVDTLVKRWARSCDCIRFPARYPLLCELMAAVQKSQSNMRSRNLTGFGRELGSLAVDTVYTVMSDARHALSQFGGSGSHL